MRNPQRYRSLAVGSARYADRRFSWKASGAKVAAITSEVVASIHSMDLSPSAFEVDTST